MEVKKAVFGVIPNTACSLRSYCTSQNTGNYTEYFLRFLINISKLMLTTDIPPSNNHIHGEPVSPVLGTSVGSSFESS